MSADRQTRGGGKRQRQEAILRVVKERRVPHLEALRGLLADRGFAVTQPTLSRDVRDLRLVKVKGAGGKAYYTLPDEWEHVPPLNAIVPALFLSVETVGNLAVVRTLSGAAQAIASGIDWEEYDGLAGTIAGDDTVLIIARSPAAAEALAGELRALASRDAG